MLHTYMTVTWLPLPCEVMMKVHTSILTHACTSFKAPSSDNRRRVILHPGSAHATLHHNINQTKRIGNMFQQSIKKKKRDCKLDPEVAGRLPAALPPL